MDKEKYTCHIRNLKYYLEKGLKLKKIHRVIEFNQDKFMEPYILFNTEMRKKAKNDFEKDFYKLMNNAVFGKTMENVRNRKDISLIYDQTKAQKIINSRLFKDYKKINDDLVLVEKFKKNVVLDKPIQIGLSILDFAKLKMYSYWYDHLKVKYGNNVDSLIFQVFTEDFYKDMYENKQFYDLSEYDKTNPIYDESNKKVLGKMKDECAKTFI